MALKSKPVLQGCKICSSSLYAPPFTAVGIDRLEKNNLVYLNDLENVLSCHFEYMGRSFFKTRNPGRLNFHVVFLMVFQFRGSRLALGIAKVSFLVTYIHINLLSIIILCTCTLSNKKSRFIRKWKYTRTCTQFEVDSRSDIFFTSDDHTKISPKWMTRWRTGKREFVNIMKSPIISAIQLICWKSLHI